MLINYSIPAIPTKYNGRQYRSRLEARWAAFWDIIGFHCEYEPYDLGEWSPDFELRGFNRGEILVEVKPIMERNEAVCHKMERAIIARDGSFHSTPLLLVGTAPVWSNWHAQVGWLGIRRSKEHPDDPVGLFYGNEYDWHPAAPAWLLGTLMPSMGVEIIGFNPDEDAPYQEPIYQAYPHHVLDAWIKATNTVQWKKPRS